MSYHAWQDGHLTGDPEPVAALAHDAFRATVLSPSFSCTAGAAAVRTGSYRFCALDVLGDPRSARQLAKHLRRFIAEFPLPSPRFATCVASFREPAAATPARFEKLLWSTLEQLHALDTRPWDPSVSSDPASPEFSFSFHGRSFFVIGMHAGSSRWTRRLAWPTLVFNAHAQFEQLRQDGRYARLSDTITKRDTRLQGGPNPNLSDFGTESEARQYSGSETGPGWRCPFPAPGSGDTAYDSAVNSPVTVRPARMADVAGMARVIVRSWQETYRGLMPDAILDDPGFIAARERFWTAALTDERYRDNRIAIAERDGELIGVAMSGPPLDEAPQWKRQLYILYVYAADHGTGAGHALLDAVVGPDDSVALWVADPNPRAQAFYRKHGFAADGSSQVDDGVREIRMVRRPIIVDRVDADPQSAKPPPDCDESASGH